MFTKRNLRWLRLPWPLPLIALTALVLMASAIPSTASALPFSLPQAVPGFGKVSIGLAVGDLNGDGKSDVVSVPYYNPVTNLLENKVVVGIGDGAGGFTSVNTFATRLRPAPSPEQSGLPT